MKKERKFVDKAARLAEDMIKLADDAEKVCGDDDSLLLFGFVRDAGYQIKVYSERESCRVEM